MGDRMPATEIVNSKLTESIFRNFVQFAPELFYPWNINGVVHDGSHLSAHGWAMPLDGLPENTLLYCNGLPATTIWSSSEAYTEMFPFWPNAREGSFSACWHFFPAEGPLVFEVRDRHGNPIDKKHRMYFDFADESSVAVPSESLISHIGSHPPQMFVQTGRTLAAQLDAALVDVSGQGFATRDAVLDWGCGSARVLQSIRLHYSRPDAFLAGIDVDSVAIDWCKAHVPSVEFKVCALDPPTDFAYGRFDVIYAYSVLTHLRRDDALAWVKEIKRLLKPGGHFIFTTLGVSSLGWLHPHGEPNISLALETQGIYDGAKNTDIDSVIADIEYYRNTWVTDNYVKQTWGEGFVILKKVACFHHYQDLWVFAKPT
jgi:SAM-dependent methyltransferase